MAQTLEKHGFNLNFAPVLDLSNNNKSFIAKKERCLSKDAKKIIAHSKEFIKTHLDNNVLTVGKHFPGQGSAIGDTHDSFVDVSKTWSSNELLPYELEEFPGRSFYRNSGSSARTGIEISYKRYKMHRRRSSGVISIEN